jgi:hypothetical protein
MEKTSLSFDQKYLEGEQSSRYISQITDVRHFAFAEITENRPLEPDNPDCLIGDRSLITLGNTDNGKPGMIVYGPRSLEIGKKVELFEFQLYGKKWLSDYLVLADDTMLE